MSRAHSVPIESAWTPIDKPAALAGQMSPRINPRVRVLLKLRNGYPSELNAQGRTSLRSTPFLLRA
jgi:hypothetical protein